MIAWYITLGVIVIGLAAWAFFFRGAEQLVELPGLFKTPPKDVHHVQIYFIAMLAGGTIALVLLFLGQFPKVSAP